MVRRLLWTSEWSRQWSSKLLLSSLLLWAVLSIILVQSTFIAGSTKEMFLVLGCEDSVECCVGHGVTIQLGSLRIGIFRIGIIFGIFNVFDGFLRVRGVVVILVILFIFRIVVWILT